MTLLSLAQAQAAVLDHLVPKPACSVPILAVQGKVLLAPLRARLALPQGDVSIMDGYAVASAGACQAGPRGLDIAGESSAGAPWAGPLPADQACRISTGALLPAGADAVVPQEDTRVEDRTVFIDRAALAGLRPGRFVRPAGADVRAGDLLGPVGCRLGPVDVALLAAQGLASVAVHPAPRVQILSTGDELVEVGTEPGRHQVVDTNAPMLAALCRQGGAEVLGRHRVTDDADALATKLTELADDTDVIVTCGGASVGDHDLLRPTLTRLGAKQLCWGIAMRPGKPTGVMLWNDTVVFVLPGNPASALVAFELIVRPALARLAGVAEPLPCWVEAVTATEFEGAAPREHFVRARRNGAQVIALDDQRSGNLRSLVGAQALVRVPGDRTSLAQGEPCLALPLQLEG